jgi:hypothetical protein
MDFLKTVFLGLAIWHPFFKFEARQTAISNCNGLSHPTQQVQIFKKCAKTTITICRGLSHPDWMGSIAL